MASPNNPKSVEQLIRQHSKARVIRATPVHPRGRKLMNIREITKNDVIDAMVRKYA